MSEQSIAVVNTRMAPQDSAWSVSRRPALYVLVFALFCLCLACTFALSRATPPNADSVQNFNELDAVFSGNVLLSHWVLASDSFYLTDLPFYVVGRTLFGNHLWLIYSVPFAIYALLLGVSLWLVWHFGAPHYRPLGAIALLCLIGVPFAPWQYMFRVSDFHTATVLFSLLAVASIAPALTGRQASRRRCILFSALLFIACASDPMADVFAGLPLLLFFLVEFWRRRGMGRAHRVLASCTLLVLICSAQFPHFIEAAHGFISKPSYSHAPVADLSDVFRNAKAVIGAFGILFGIRSLPVMPLAPIISFIRALYAVWVLLSIVALLAAARTAPHLNVARFLVFAACCLITADCLSATFSGAITHVHGVTANRISAAFAGHIPLGSSYPNGAVRYVAPAYLFLCIAAALAPMPLPAPTLIRRLFTGTALVAGAIMFAALVEFGFGRLLNPPGLQVPPAYQLASWLYARHLTYGVGDYYTTQLIRAFSRGQVMADPTQVCQGRLCPRRFWTDTTRFDHKARPQFVVFPLRNWFSLTEADAVRTYGSPLLVTSVRGVVVLLYFPMKSAAR